MDFKFQVDAPREVVFEVMTDHAGYSEFTPLWRTKVEKEGEREPNGVGAVRAFKSLPVAPTVREEIIAYDAPATMSYRLLSGLPLKDHVGTITLIEAADGTTELRYHVESDPAIPVAKFLPLALIRKAIRDLGNGIKAEAERRAAG